MMKKANQRNRFILACLLCVLIPLMLGIFSYYGTCNILRRNAIDMNRAVLENAMDLSDMQYEEIDTLCRQMYLAVSNSQILHASNISQFAMQVKKMDLISSVSKLAQGVNYLNRYYLYLKPLDTIITEDSAYANPSLFYRDNLLGEEARIDQWRENLAAPRRFLTARAESLAQRPSLQNTITFYRSFPFFPYDKPQGCIVLNVSQSVLRDFFSPLENSGACYRVVDEDGKALFSTPEFPVFASEIETGESVTKNAEGIEYAVISVTSPVNGWRFDAATNTATLYASLNIYRWIYFTLTAIILLLGAVFSVGMALHAMKPVNQLIDRSNRLEQTVSRQSVMLSETLWEKLLSGEIKDEKTADALMEVAGMRLKGSRFIAADIRCEDTVREDNLKTFETRIESGYIYQPKKNEIMLCVPLEGERIDMQAMIRGLNEAMAASGLKGRIGIGRPCETLSLFYRSYFEAETALVYARSANLDWAAYESMGGITEYLRTLAGTGEQLLQVVMSGQMEETQKALQRIRDEYFMDRRRGQFIKLQIIYELRHIVIRCTSALPGEHGLDEELLTSLSRQSVLEDPDAEYDSLCTTLTAFCALREQELVRDKSRTRTNDMIQFVNAHYQDAQLSLRAAAEHFDMNETYFSSYFKQNSGVGFVDYLQQLRIERSIELIQEGKLKIADIAEAVGYTNDQTFRRAFKRVMGVSPTAYKDASMGAFPEKEEEE